MPDKNPYWRKDEPEKREQERSREADEKSARYGKQSAKVTARPSISKQHGPQTHRKG